MQALFFGLARTTPRTKRGERLHICVDHFSGKMMELTTDVPQPGGTESGVAGTQRPGDLGNVVPTPPPLEGELLPGTFIDFIRRSPSDYGGDDMAPAIAALINDTHADKLRARQDVAGIQAQLNKAISDLHEQKLINASLQSQINGGVVLSRIQRICAFCSPIGFGVAIDLYKANLNSAFIVGALALIFLLTNFIPGKKS